MTGRQETNKQVLNNKNGGGGSSSKANHCICSVIPDFC
jgi:hypothetical protein